jgi:4,4'-diaponeurosporenoate glycosyltransferase
MIFLLASICWLAGFAILWRVPTCGKGSDSAQVNVSIIIPARDEANSLPRLLESLSGQTARPREIIVVDDDSTDETAAVAKAGGANVIASAPLPDGWRGKTWACHQGATAATAPALLFLDADARFEKDGLARISAAYYQQPNVLSVIPHHHVPTAVEQLSAFFNLIMTAGIGAFAIFDVRRVGMFGQMMLIDRELYTSIGGHERVKEHVLENLHMARFLREIGVKPRCAAGRGCLSMRMYPGGLAEMVHGWTKGFASGAGTTPPIVLALAIAWLSGAVMAAAGALRFHNLPALVIYAAYVGQIYWQLRRIGSFWLITAVLYPIPLLFFFGVFFNSILRLGRPVTWKGRAIRAA